MSRLNYSTIFKRSSCLNSTESKIDSEKLFNLLENNQLKSIKEQHRMSVPLKNGIDNYFNSLSNKENASQYWYRGLDIIQRLNENGCKHDATKLLDKYNSNILPYVENMEGVLESLDNYNLTDTQYEKIKSLCEDYKFADQVINNHTQISKRFNIEYEIKSVKIKGLYNVVESCCSMIDTYSYEPYQKLNIAIDEMTYLFEKNNIDYKQEELLSNILEYFLLRSSQITDRDIKGYRFVMNNNKSIDDISSFKFLFENFKVINIRSAINDYLKIQEKNPENTRKEFIDIISNTSIEDLKNNIGLLVDFLYKLYTSQTCVDCGSEEMLKVISDILSALVDRYIKESMIEFDNITRDDVEELITNLSTFNSKINVINSDDPNAVNKITFKNLIKCMVIDRLNDLANSIYSRHNIKSLDFVNKADDLMQTIPLNEYRIFKYNDIIKSINNFDNFLKSKMKNIYNESNSDIKLSGSDIKKIIYQEDGSIDRDSIYSFIGNDNKVDICLCQIELDSEDKISTMLNELSVLCKEFNNELKNNRMDTIRSYYLINGCIAEVHLKDATNIDLTETEKEIANESYKPELDIYIDQLSLFEACNKISENFVDKTLEETVASIFSEDKEYTIEAYDVMMEALSFLNPEKYIIDNLTESFSRHRDSILTESSEIITENRYIKSIYNNWEPLENVPYDIQVEAYNILNTIIQEAAPKIKKPKVGAAVMKSSTNNKDSKGKEDYNPSSSISNKINNLKIFLHGLKSKLKDLGQKEKQLSKNLDITVNNLAKSIKDSFISDKREQIIKGKVIPSFSKSLKIAVALGLAGVVTGNPLIPILAAIGGLATSKKLSNKERMLLLDEIETELEVLEKEIAIADSKNQIKKYRTLLQYKKNLQRQYQRIKYNLRVGKDILPSSSAGMKSND